MIWPGHALAAVVADAGRLVKWLTAACAAWRMDEANLRHAGIAEQEVRPALQVPFACQAGSRETDFPGSLQESLYAGL